MTIEITRIVVLVGHGCDKIMMETMLPCGTWPYKGCESVIINVATNTGEDYVKKHFPGVEIDKILIER